MIIAGAIVGVLAVIMIISVTINKLNYYPQLKVYINITNKRNMNDADTCLNFYFNNYATEEITEHLNAIQTWKKEKLISCKDKQKKMVRMQNRWEKNCHKAFRFIAFRTQTKYSQANYVRTAYKDDVTYFDFCLSDAEVAQRINYTISLLDIYLSKNEG